MISDIEKFRERIPLYMTGRLTDAEAAEMEAAFKAFPELSAELKEFEAIGAAYRELEGESAAPREALFDQIIAAVRSEEKEEEKTSPQKEWIGRFRGLIEMAFASPRIAWSLAALQLIVIVILLWSGPSERRYITLTAPAGPAESQPRIRVAFVETATEGEIRALLSGLNASIIAGPSLEGVYTIVLKAGPESGSEMEALRHSPLIRYVEILSGS